MSAITIADLISVRNFLWPVLDFLSDHDVAHVAQLSRSSNNCCKGYCLKWSWIRPTKDVGKFTYRRGIVCNIDGMKKLPTSIRELRVSSNVLNELTLNN